MIAYQVPAVMRHLSAVQVFEEGATSFLAVGIFSYLADTGSADTAKDLEDLTEAETESAAEISEALLELENLQLIEQVNLGSDIDGMLAELSGEVQHG